jgi:hypothetical protein
MGRLFSLVADLFGAKAPLLVLNGENMNEKLRKVIDRLLETAQEESERVFAYIISSIETLPVEEQDAAMHYVADTMARQDGVDSRFEAQYGIKIQ